MTKEPITEIWQGNEITHAQYYFNAIEINILCLIIYKLQYYSDSNYYELPITSDEYIEKTGLNPSHRSEIKKAIKGIMKKPFSIITKEQDEIISVICSGVKFEKKTGTFYINIDPFILPYVQDISKNTTRYYLETILSMKGKNAKRLYQYVSMFKKAGKFTMYFDDIRSKLFDDPKYTEFKSFLKYVIEPSIKEINEKSQLKIGYEIDNKYGKSKSITFNIAQKNENAYNLYYENPEKLRVYSSLLNWGIKDYFAKLSIETIGVVQIEKLAFKVLEKSQKKQVRNKGAYLRKLLVEAGVPERNKK